MLQRLGSVIVIDPHTDKHIEIFPIARHRQHQPVRFDILLPRCQDTEPAKVRYTRINDLMVIALNHGEGIEIGKTFLHPLGRHIALGTLGDFDTEKSIPKS